MRTRLLAPSAALLFVALVAPGCILDNPAFDELTIGEGTLSDSGDSDSDSAGASGYGTSLSGGESDSGTTGDDSGSGGESEGTTTGLGTDGTTTGDETTGDATTSAGASDSGTTDASDSGDMTDSGETGDTTGEPESMELKHYTDGSCNTTFWCQPMNNPAPAVNLAVECFDSGLTPPYVVDRVDFEVFKTLGSAPVEIQVFEFNEQFNAPKLEPAATQWYGTIAGSGMFSEAIDPVVINTEKVCVGVLSGNNESQLGVAANGVKPPFGQSFLGGSGTCMLNTHTDIAGLMGSSTWCMSAWVRPE